MGTIFFAGFIGFIALVLYFGLGFVKDKFNIKPLQKIIGIAGAVLASFVLLSGMFFYAEPGYNYHIRTITGAESVATTTGWKFKLFGKVEPWKKAISVATTNDQSIDPDAVSVLRGCLTVRMLDKVDGCLSTSVRFRMPDDTESMLRLAREYRTQGNLLSTALVPGVNRVMNATAQLMSAEEFFNGGRSTFDADFDYQMRNGVFQVRRIEVDSKPNRASNRKAANNATTLAEGAATVVEEDRTDFEIEKLLDKNGQPLILDHNFVKFGVVVEDAIVTDFDPNKEFVQRLSSIQEASAARAQARERRIQEEEQRLLAIAKGEREQAEIQAEALKAQIKETTEAETSKQLALTNATKIKEQAEIEKEAAAIALERDRLIAESQQVLADAEAYQKEAVMRADNALDKKLQAEIEIQKVWAEAFAKRAVPSTVIATSGGSGDTPTGGNTELNQILQMMSIQMARNLDYDRKVDNNGPRPGN